MILIHFLILLHYVFRTNNYNHVHRSSWNQITAARIENDTCIAYNALGLSPHWSSGNYGEYFMSMAAVCCTANTASPTTSASSNPTLQPTPDSDPNCDYGIFDDQYGTNACCPATCGSCGGDGCWNRPGGSTHCCVGTVSSNGLSCDHHPAPCIVNGTRNPTYSPTNTPSQSPTNHASNPMAYPTVEPTIFYSVDPSIDPTQEPTSNPTSDPTLPTFAPTPSSDPNCDYGIYHQPTGTCCPIQCGSCGGVDCGFRPGGGSHCCNTAIAAKGLSCNDNPAPCNIYPTSPPTDDPTEPTQRPSQFHHSYNIPNNKICIQY